MKKPRILIIEDEHDVRVTLRQILQDHGCVVWTATNGTSAFNLLEQINRPCVILLDVMMPIMNGVEFLKEKEHRPKIADIPVIAMTAFQESPLFVRGAVQATIQKPFDPSKLLGLLQPFLENCPPEELGDEEELGTTVVG
jgi:CheY-like chemotaxis protein